MAGPDVPTVPPAIRNESLADYDGLNVVQFEDPFDIIPDLNACQGIVALGGKVSLGIGKLVGTHHDHVDEMMEEMLIHERAGVELYRKLLRLVEGKSVSLEELAREMVRNEELHIAEIEKMLRKRGDA